MATCSNTTSWTLTGRQLLTAQPPPPPLLLLLLLLGEVWEVLLLLKGTASAAAPGCCCGSGATHRAPRRASFLRLVNRDSDDQSLGG
jgi:hypothetical protein